MPITYEPIATTTLGSGSATVNFNSIPSTYTDLKLIYTGSAGNINFIIQLNSDSGSNYSYTLIQGDGTSATSSSSTSQTSGRGGYISTTQISFIEIDFFSYAGSTNKTFLASSSADMNGSGVIRRLVNLWRSTSAITSINLSNTVSFNTGSTFTLYGIKNA